MAEAYIIDTVRTPVGKRGGGLSQVHPADLGAHTLKALVERTGHRPGRGRRRGDRLPRHDRPAGRRHRPHLLAGRRAARARARAPRSTASAGRPSRPCTSPRRASCRAPRTWSSPAACRTCRPSRSRSAMLVAEQFGVHRPVLRLDRAGSTRYGNQEISQFRGADMIAEKWDISREEMEDVRDRVAHPCPQGPRRGPLRARDRRPRRAHPGRGPPRAEPREDPLAASPLIEGGRVTAAVASQISDASAAMLIASEQAVKDHGLTPAGPHPPPVGAWRRPDLHADGADPGDAAGARARPA